MFHCTYVKSIITIQWNLIITVALGPNLAGCYIEVAFLLSGIQNHNYHSTYRPFYVGVASRLATAIYVAMVTPILYDNCYSLNDSNLKYESYRPYG